MKTKIVMLLLIFLISCKDKEEKIEYLLHDDKAILWGVYDKNFRSKGFSYQLIKENKKCEIYDEDLVNIFSEYKFGTIPNKANYVGDIRDIGILNTWNISIVNNKIYLRCWLESYYVIDYSENYFNLLSNLHDTIYLVKTECQSDNCFIPKNVLPGPF